MFSFAKNLCCTVRYHWHSWDPLNCANNTAKSSIAVSWTPPSRALDLHWIFECGVLGVFQHLVLSTVFFISWISLQKWNLFQNHDHKSFIVSYQFIILSVPCHFCFFFSNTKFRLKGNYRRKGAYIPKNNMVYFRAFLQNTGIVSQFSNYIFQEWWWCQLWKSILLFTASQIKISYMAWSETNQLSRMYWVIHKS